MELKKTYSACRAVILPQKEDFGLVALEANASGKPVICYGQGGVKTTMIKYNGYNEDSATAIFYDRQEVDDLIEAVSRFNIVDFNKEALIANAGRFEKNLFMRRIKEIIIENSIS